MTDEATNERLTPDEKRRIELGDDIAAFMQTDIGKYLAKRAEDERVELLEQLASVDPFDAKAVAKLQIRVAVLDSWQEWFAEALHDADQTERQALLAQTTDLTGA